MRPPNYALTNKNITEQQVFALNNAIIIQSVLPENC